MIGGPLLDSCQVGSTRHHSVYSYISGGYKTKLKGPGIAVSMYRWRDWVTNIVAGREGKDC